jgi:hypothetical protein
MKQSTFIVTPTAREERLQRRGLFLLSYERINLEQLKQLINRWTGIAIRLYSYKAFARVGYISCSIFSKDITLEYSSSLLTCGPWLSGIDLINSIAFFSSDFFSTRIYSISEGENDKLTSDRRGFWFLWLPRYCSYCSFEYLNLWIYSSNSGR